MYTIGEIYKSYISGVLLMCRVKKRTFFYKSIISLTYNMYRRKKYIQNILINIAVKKYVTLRKVLSTYMRSAIILSVEKLMRIIYLYIHSFSTHISCVIKICCVVREGVSCTQAGSISFLLSLQFFVLVLEAPV